MRLIMQQNILSLSHLLLCRLIKIAEWWPINVSWNVFLVLIFIFYWSYILQIILQESFFIPWWTAHNNAAGHDRIIFRAAMRPFRHDSDREQRSQCGKCFLSSYLKMSIRISIFTFSICPISNAVGTLETNSDECCLSFREIKN